MSNDYQTGNFISFEDETVQASKRIGGNDDTPTSIAFPAVLVYYCFSVLRVPLH